MENSESSAKRRGFEKSAIEFLLRKYLEQVLEREGLPFYQEDSTIIITPLNRAADTHYGMKVTFGNRRAFIIKSRTIENLEKAFGGFTVEVQVDRSSLITLDIKNIPREFIESTIIPAVLFLPENTI